MIDKIKEFDTAVVTITMILGVVVLSLNGAYNEPASLFFTGLAGYILGGKKNA